MDSHIGGLTYPFPLEDGRIVLIVVPQPGTLNVADLKRLTEAWQALAVPDEEAKGDG